MQDFDICWLDMEVQPDILQRIKIHQRISQVPGIKVIANKHHLGKNLMAMLKYLPADFNFFPETYQLPSEMREFRKLLEETNEELEDKQERPFFIIKPDVGCKGQGIYLTQQADDIYHNAQVVA